MRPEVRNELGSYSASEYFRVATHSPRLGISLRAALRKPTALANVQRILLDASDIDEAAAAVAVGFDANSDLNAYTGKVGFMKGDGLLTFSPLDTSTGVHSKATCRWAA